MQYMCDRKTEIFKNEKNPHVCLLKDISDKKRTILGLQITELQNLQVVYIIKSNLKSKKCFICEQSGKAITTYFKQ